MHELQKQLNEIHEAFESSVSDDILEVMHRGTDDLIASGLHHAAAGAGDQFPDFVLNDSAGGAVSSEALLGKGPILLNFFRGFW